MFDVVGDVQLSDNKARWTIPRFFLSSWKEGYQSPDFQLGTAYWYLRIRLGSPHPEERDEWVSLQLHQTTHVTPGIHCASYTLGIEDMHGKTYVGKIVKDCRVEREFIKFFEIEIINLFKRSKFQEDRCYIEQDKDLTVFCIMRFVEKAASLITLPKVKRATRNNKALFESKEDSDVVLKVMDREFRAHRRILSAQSPVFNAMFLHDTAEKRSGIVEIPDCDLDTFQEFLLYLYSGEVDMTPDNVFGLHGTSDKYAVDDLREECEQFMIKDLEVDTFCDYVPIAWRRKDSAFLEACTAFFTQNTMEIITTAAWKSFLKKNSEAANELYIKAYEMNCLN